MDEHFQILEPLAFKLNLRNNVNTDIWEFGATMRPWSQIYLSLFIIIYHYIYNSNYYYIFNLHFGTCFSMSIILNRKT